MKSLADLEAVISAARAAWRPPPRLSLSEWADQYFYLSAESAAEPGRWKTLPYQKGIMDAITDPTVERVSVQKSARIGYTKCINAVIGYHIHQAPCPILVVQPTLDDARGYSREEIAPMLRDCSALSQIAFGADEEAATRDSNNTILHKKFPGGVLSLVGANSGAGFRRISRKVVLFDEVDGYAPSAGAEGDQIKLGIRRTEYYHDRKIVAGSSPRIAGLSRIEEMFRAGDQRRYFVPCPQCGHRDVLAFRESPNGGHFMQWPKDRPQEAHFVCSKNGCVIEHRDKRAMVAAGGWRAAQPFRGHASFHIWAAYSYSPNATWGQIAQEFVDANKSGPEALKTFINTVLGETWRESGEAPDWQRLYAQREHYPIGIVPPEVIFLTAGVDVQKDRWVWEVVGWGPGKQSWSIDSGIIPGDTSNETEWTRLNVLLDRSWATAEGIQRAVLMLAIDSGYNTQMVYNWARCHSMSRVIATKGVSSARLLIGTPSPVDVKVNGKRLARGYKVWPTGVDIAKAELYGWLRLQPPTKEGAAFPPGYCHFPEYGEDFFQQLTAEHLVPVVQRKGYTVHEWQLIPNRQNHVLDARILARVAAALVGMDRLLVPPATQTKPATAPPPPTAAPALDPPTRPGGWLQAGTARFPDSRFRAKGWLKR